MGYASSLRLARAARAPWLGWDHDHPRTVLVTGGNRGIGFAIAEEFVAQGHRVAVTARSGEGPEGALTVRADVTDAASLDAAFTEVEEKLGPVEVVVANAGITRDTLLLRMSEDDFTQVVDTNLRRRLPRREARIEGHAEGAVRPRHPRLQRRRAARQRRPGQLRGLEGRTRRASPARSPANSARRGITANVVAPGFIETDMTAELPEDQQKRVPVADPRRTVRLARRGGAHHHLARVRRRRLHLRRGHPRRRRPRHGPLTRSRREAS